jgi:hypothetical protein
MNSPIAIPTTTRSSASQSGGQRRVVPRAGGRRTTAENAVARILKVCRTDSDVVAAIVTLRNTPADESRQPGVMMRVAERSLCSSLPYYSFPATEWIMLAVSASASIKRGALIVEMPATSWSA